MPVPLPERPRLGPPDPAEATAIHRGIAGVAAGPDGLTPLQQILLTSITHALTGVTPTSDDALPLEQFAAGLAERNLAFRTRIVQMALLVALVLHPIPAAVGDQLRRLADELGVHDDVIGIAEAYASGALDLAAADFQRNGYLAAVDPARVRAMHAAALEAPWAFVDDDPALAGLWASLADLPVGTLGRGVADFYRDRGFVYPGRPGSAPPALAQHDWVHVLAGYGTTLEGELEVFGFMARANDDPRAFSLLAMVVSLFETGSLVRGAGLFEADPGHLSTTGAAPRLADAMRRGALMRGSTDFLAYDWFEVADRPVAVLRRELELPPKSRDAVAAGSAGPWEPGGITEHQLAAARTAQGAEYVPWHPDPERV